MRKSLILMVLLGLSLFSCKKETAFSVPEPEDFTGRYAVSGTVEVPSGIGPQPFLMATGYDAASGSTCELITNYFSHQGYRLASSILREDLRLRSFLPMFYGGAAVPNQPINQWTVAELDSIFKVGNRLPFGKGFGQVEIEFADVLSAPVARLYSTENISNATNTVLIEQIEDVAEKFAKTADAAPWAKIVTFSFSCNLRIVTGEQTYEFIALKNCRATMLLKPYIKG